MTSAGKVRPTVRFTPAQYALISAKLKERDVSFQAYCVELICADLGIPVEDFDDVSAEPVQLNLFEAEPEGEQP